MIFSYYIRSKKLLASKTGVYDDKTVIKYLLEKVVNL